MKNKKNVVLLGILLPISFLVLWRIYPSEPDFQAEINTKQELIQAICRQNLTTKQIEKGTIIEVIDGDTVVAEINNKQENVRLIGINTPEISHSLTGSTEFYGEEAHNFQSWFLNKKQVLLEADKTNRDDYNRLLRYIYLSDGTMVNCVLPLLGYAHEMAIAPNTKYKSLFVTAASHAMQDQLGIWGR